jgi:hypothetical protein
LGGKGSLQKDRVTKLESIGFKFAGQASHSGGWDAFFEELRDYLRNHGDCNVPKKYHLNPSLGEWVRKQRHDYSLKCDGYYSFMTAEHEAKLNVLGFSWAKRQSSSVGSNDNNNVLCPDKVSSESLAPMSRQRTSQQQVSRRERLVTDTLRQSKTTTVQRVDKKVLISLTEP